MADGPKIQGEVSLSTENVETGLNRISDKAGQMAVNMAEAGAKAGKAIAQIGEIAAASGETMTRSEAGIVTAFKRVAAEAAQAKNVAESLGKIEFNIAAKGLDAAKFAPMLAVVKDVEAHANTASSSLNKMGMSAAATANAMRMVPAQMTDIIVSLQSGQAPLTVLMQQGGQLKDMFGGVGNAAKAMGTYIVSMVNPLTLTAAAAGALGYAFYAGAEESKGMAQALILTGNAAGQSVGSMYKMAEAIAATTGATKGASVDALGQVMATGKVAAGNLQLVADAAVTMERATGTAVKDTVAQFAELGKSPAAASAKLNEQYGYLTASVYAQIKALEDQGKTQEAVSLAQETFANATESMAKKVAGNLGWIERAWRAIKDEAKSAGDVTLGVGREKTLEDQLATAVARRDGVSKPKSRVFITGDSSAEAANAVIALQQQIKLRDDIAAQEAKSIAVEKQKIQQVNEAGKLREKYLTNEQRMKKELEALNDNALRSKTKDDGLLTQKELEDAEKLIREKYKDKAVKEQVSDYAKLVASIKEKTAAQDAEIVSGANLNAGEQLRAKILAETESGTMKLSAAQKQSALAMADSLSQSAKQIDAQKEMSKAYEEAYKAEMARANTVSNSAKSIEQEAEAIRLHTQEIGLSAGAIEELKAQRDADTVALKEHELAELDATGQCTAYSEALRAQIGALKERQKALGEQSTKQFSADADKIAKKSADDAAKEWQKTADKIGDSITDALMRGFESGKSFAETLRDTVVNMFKTMVLQPVIKATVIGGLSAIGLGSGAATASDSIGGLGSLSNLASMGNTANSIFTMGSQVAGGYGALPGTTTLAEASGALGGDSVGTLLSLNPHLTATAAEVGSTAGAAAAASYAAAAGSVGATASMASAYSVGAAGSAAGGAATAGLAAVPVAGWVALAAIAAYSIFGGKDAGPKYEGNYFGVLDNAGSSKSQQYATWWSHGTGYSGDSADGQLAEMAPSLTSAINGLVTSLGGTAAGIGVNYGFNHDASGGAQDQISTVVSDSKGSIAYENSYSMSSGGYKDALALEMQRMTLGAIKAADGIKPIFKELVSGIDLASASAETMTKAISDLQGIVTLRAAFDNLNLGADNLSLSLISAAGGASTLSSELEGYYTTYFSEAEKTQKLTDSMTDSFAAMGMKMPESKAAFRSVVEGLDLTTTAGQSTFAAMMRLAPSFAAVTDAAAAAAEKLSSTRDTLMQKYSDPGVSSATAVEYARLAIKKSGVLNIDGLDANGIRGQLRQVIFGATQDTIDAISGLSSAFDTVIQSLTADVEAAAADRKEMVSARRAAAAAEKAAIEEAAATAAEAWATRTQEFMDKRADYVKAGDTASIMSYEVARIENEAHAEFGPSYVNMGFIRAMRELTAAMSVNAEMSRAALSQVDLERALTIQIPESAATALYNAAKSESLNRVGATIESPKILTDLADFVMTTQLPSERLSMFKSEGVAEVRRQKALAALDMSMNANMPKLLAAAMSDLNSELADGAISAAEYAKAAKKIDWGKWVDIQVDMGKIVDAGNDSIRLYLSSMGELAKTTEEAGSALSLATDMMGRMKSAATVFSESADAATSMGDYTTLSDKAYLIAAAARIAGEVATTQSAAEAAARLKTDPAIAGVSDTHLRDMALLLDGVKAYDSAAFERVFNRLGSALGKDVITNDEYVALMTDSINVFSGVDAATEAVKTSMQSLADAMGSFADELLIDGSKTTLAAGQSLAETMRQYEIARTSAMTGDSTSVGNYKTLATALLDKSKYDSQADYNNAFGKVYGDARSLESLGVASVARAGENSVVSELKSLNTTLSNRVDSLEKNLTTALAQIARNTAKTSAGIEQINTVGVPT